MNRLIAVALVTILLVGGILLAAGIYANRPVVQTTAAATTAPEAEPTPNAGTSQPTISGGRVVAEGIAVPFESMYVTFGTSGTVADVLAREGQQVKRGDPLARLDTTLFELDVRDAEARLAQIRTEYEAVAEGPLPEEISQLRARVARAAAELRRAQTQVTEQDVAAARASLEATQAALELLETGPKGEEIEIARATLAQTQENLQAVRDRLSADKERANSQIQQTANDLRTLQDYYSRLKWRNIQIVEQERRDLLQVEIDEEAAALRKVQNAEEELRQQIIAYEAAVKAETTGIAIAETRVRDAQLRLTLLTMPTDNDQLTAARARLADAEARISSLNGEARDSQIAAARAVLADAQASLDLLLATPRASDLAIMRARVQQAEVDVDRAKIDLERATMRAPFDGTVVLINFRPGDKTDVAYVVVADTSDWRVETTNMNELGAVRVREGDQATITFIALPEVTLTGRVTAIRTTGLTGERQPDYTVVIKPDSWDPRLLWNMRATVTIMQGK